MNSIIVTNDANQPTDQTTDSNWTKSPLVDFLCVFCIFFLYAGNAVPSINEPHYWTKAAHFWNSDFGKNDLFLESGDAHWFFFATFGYLTQCMPLPTAVWTGRFMTWIFLALGWTLLGRSLWLCGIPRDSEVAITSARSQIQSSSTAPMLASCWALVWLAGMHYGHWAGEWVVGGCESKGIAYACIFAGLALVIRHRWTLAWTLLGLASAFHVVTGIWVIACVVCVSFVTDRGLRTNVSIKRSFSQWVNLHRWGWLFCIAGVVAGAVPALAIDWGTDPVLAGESAVKQVYTRLGHHLAPSRFNWIRWRDFCVQLVFACILGRIAMQSKVTRNHDSNGEENHFPRGLQLVIGWGLFAFAVALLGMVIDLAFGTMFPLFAAKLLRFYLFRWNDVAMPMMVGALATSFAFGRIYLPSSPKGVRLFAWLYLLIPGLILLLYRFESNFNEIIPAGDKAHFVAKSDSDAEQIKQFQNWLRVCDWISKNTDKDSLWLTPRRQQSFKWHTGRPELACWKDAPQNAEAVVEWSQRLADAYQFDKTKILQPWTTEKLWELHNKYGIRYVLVDLRVVGQTPPLLPILYPSQNEFNETFAVFELTPQKANASK